MHGRVKVISSEEQKARQQKVRCEKVAAYKVLFKEIVEKRESKSSHNELQKITSEVLLGNPDIVTLWNIRREILLKGENEQSTFQESLLAELPLTLQCFLVNPKSYCTWHHRLWCLSHLPEDYWDKELAICDAYLSKDERNFHCWDYRKIVVQRASITKENDLKFTSNKLESNFSNYSAWHYRSKLLPVMYPDADEKLPITESCLKEELGIVQSAVYTDPFDQSAWFYQRWLLGLKETPLRIVSAGIMKNTITVAFSESIQLGTTHVLHAIKKDDILPGQWQAFEVRSVTSKVWFMSFDQNTEIHLKFEEMGEVKNAELETIVVSPLRPYTRSLVMPLLNDVSRALLSNELNEMKQLHDLEDENKWVKLALVDVMRSLDFKKYSYEILELLQSVKKVDYLRQNFYNDLTSKIIIERQLLSLKQETNFTLKNCSLTSLYHTQYLSFVKCVDLSRNCLRSADLANLKCLIMCEELDLSNNCITYLITLPKLSSLIKLNITENPLKDPQADKIYVSSFCKQLTL